MSRNFVVAVANMPWTLEDMTPEQLQQWIASRKEAGRSINIGTCELGRWAAYDCDPYGINPNLPEEMQQIGTNRFVRSPESRGWVWEGDLPMATAKAMYNRIRREWEEYVRRHPDDPYVRANKQPAPLKEQMK
jgi:hypothetical protein